MIVKNEKQNISFFYVENIGTGNAGTRVNIYMA